MPVVSSNLTQESAQRDGRYWVRELHVDAQGGIHEFRYIASVGSDTANIMAGRVSALNQMLTDNEIAANLLAVGTLGRNAVVTFNDSTVAANAAAVRAAYASMTQTQAIFTGDFLASLTDLQLENAFALTQAQVTTLRTNRLTPATTAATTIRAAAGA